MDWSDYLMTKTWVDDLVNRSLVGLDGNDVGSTDVRVQTLSEMVQEMMKDHVLQCHDSLGLDFNPDEFLDNEYLDGAD